MSDPQAILLQVEQGDIPTTWQIFKGKDARFVQGIGGGTFLLLFLFFVVWGIDQQFLHLHLLFSSFPHVSPLFPYIAVGMIIIAVLYGFYAWSQAARRRDSVLVLMPDGLVQCTNYHHVEKRKCKSLSYADVASMTFRRRDRSTSSPKSVDSVHIDYTIDITYKNGQSEQWAVDTRFGSPDDLAHMMIRAYEKYRSDQAS